MPIAKENKMIKMVTISLFLIILFKRVAYFLKYQKNTIIITEIKINQE
jgi:hypothetical protein